jgi:hypothetical protein
MVKKWPDGPVPGSETPRRRQSMNVQVGLAAMADGLGPMVWIAAGHRTDGLSVLGYYVDEQGLAYHRTLVSDVVPDHDQSDHCLDDETKDDCERGGFGWTGSQFYKTEVGP